MSEPRPALFPARVTLPDGSVHHPVRVATDPAGTTHAWGWDHTAGAATEIASWPADQLTRADDQDRGRPQAFTVTDGTEIEGRDQGCGCSHPLKAWRPRFEPTAA